MQSAAVEDDLLALEEDVLGGDASVDEVVVVQLFYGFGQLHAYPHQFAFHCFVHPPVQSHAVVALYEVDDVSLAEVGHSGECFEVELVPHADFVVDVFEDVAGYFVFGDADEVVFALEQSSFREPDGLFFVFLDVCEFAEAFEFHYFDFAFASLLLVAVLDERAVEV